MSNPQEPLPILTPAEIADYIETIAILAHRIRAFLQLPASANAIEHVRTSAVSK